MIGIDTLKLRLSDYKISATPHLRVKQPDIDAQTGEMWEAMSLWRTSDGQYMKGTRAWFDGDSSLDVHLGRFGSDEIEKVGVGCWVEFSVPRRAVGNNFHAVGRDETIEAIRGVESQLDDIGISTNIWTSHLSRIDAKNTIETIEPFACYRGLYDLMKVPRTQARDYGTTYLWANTRQQVCCYDKVVESNVKEKAACKKKKIKFILDNGRGNWTNFEHRAIKPDKVRSVSGIGLAVEIETDYHKIAEGFQGAMKKYFFKHEVDDIVAASRVQLEEEMRQFRRFYGRNWLEAYVKAEGIRSLTGQHGMDIVLDAVKRVAGDETRAGYLKGYRLAKKLEKAQWEMSLLLDDRPSQRTMKDLYVELRDKVLLQT